MSRPYGSASALEQGRRQAVQAVHAGDLVKDVARIVGVHPRTVSRWLAQAHTPDGLAAKPHPGPATRLNHDQQRQLEGLLLQGAKAHGWANELWTTRRIAELIRQKFNVSLHPDHVGRFLHNVLHWSPQKPRKIARERDEDSAISGISLSPERFRLNFYFTLLPDKHNVKAVDVVAFLRHLKRQLGGPFTVLWDGSNTHSRARLVKAYLAQHPEIVAETLPAYTPEINPDENVWSWTKYGRLANLAAQDTGELRRRIEQEFSVLKSNRQLLDGFIRDADLWVAA